MVGTINSDGRATTDADFEDLWSGGLPEGTWKAIRQADRPVSTRSP